jgi:ankyrin repeat protein
MRKIKKIIENKRGVKHMLKQSILDCNYTLLQELVNNNYYDLNKLDEYYFSYLDYALISKNIDIIKFFVIKKVKLGLTLYQINKEEIFLEKIKLLHNAGYDLNRLDIVGFAPIHYASSLGFVEALKLLMKYNVTIFKLAINGETPVRSAIKNSKIGVYLGSA